MRKNIILIFFLVFISSVYGDIKFNEIMYNPEGADTGYEWIELKFSGNQRINISNIKFREADTNHKLKLISGSDSFNSTTFVLIVKDLDKFNEGYNVDSNIFESSFSLSNSGEELIILDSYGEIYDNITYVPLSNEGNSLSYINNSWVESSPTPGEINELFVQDEEILIDEIKQTKDFEIILNMNRPYLTNLNYNLFKIKNLNYPDDNTQQNLTFYVNISTNNSLIYDVITYPSFKSYTTKNTGNFLFYDSGNYTLCGKIKDYNISECFNVDIINSNFLDCNVTLDLDVDKLIYEYSEKIKIKHILSDKTYPYFIEYYVEDIFGEIIKNPIITTNVNQKTFSPKFSGSEKAFIIKSKLNNVYCNNSASKLEDEKIVLVKGNTDQQTIISETGSFLSINSYDDSIVFGDILNVKINVQKGDTQKYSVKLYVVDNKNNKVSETISLNFYDKNTEYNLNVQIPLDNNCKFKSGDYKITLIGLDRQDTQTCYIEQTKCLDLINYEKKDNLKEEEYELIYFQNSTRINSSLYSFIKLNNLENKTINYSLWSYIYNGPKIYSGDRFQNLKSIVLKPNTHKIIAVETKLIEKPNNPKLKIKILKEGRKTNYERRKNIP